MKLKTIADIRFEENIDSTKNESFSLRISSVNVIRSANYGLVTFTEEILNEKLHFLCSDRLQNLKILIEIFQQDYSQSDISVL